MYLVFSLLLFLFVDVPVPDARQYNLYVGGQLVGRDAEDPSLGRMEIGTTPEGKTLPWLAPILEEKESKLQTMEYGRTWKLTLVQLLFLLMSYFLVLTTVLGLTFATLIFRI